MPLYATGAEMGTQDMLPHEVIGLIDEGSEGEGRESEGGGGGGGSRRGRGKRSQGRGGAVRSAGGPTSMAPLASCSTCPRL